MSLEGAQSKDSSLRASARAHIITHLIFSDDSTSAALNACLWLTLKSAGFEYPDSTIDDVAVTTGAGAGVSSLSLLLLLLLLLSPMKSLSASTLMRVHCSLKRMLMVRPDGHRALSR